MLSSSIVKVIGYNDRHRMSFGSGVVIAEDTVATNCHVTRFAHSIAVFKAGKRYRVILQAAEPELDLCLLHLKNLNLPAITLADMSQITTGDKVLAIGYPNGAGISQRRGRIIKLHPFRGSYIIETDIGIHNGASGGGLFNQNSELLGLTTFFRRNQGGHYFVIPASWLKQALPAPGQAISPLTGKAFWQQALQFEKQEYE